MSRLALYTLGSPRIERDGVLVPIPRRRVIGLLVYLAVTGRTHRRDTLSTLFYPEHDQGGAHARLRRALSTLKAALGAGWLEVDLETVRLNLDAGPPASDPTAGQTFWLDVTVFQALLNECRSHDRLSEQACPACLPLLTKAVALYRDDFLAGFTLRDSPRFDNWQSLQTSSLRDQMASALERLAYGHGSQGQFEQAVAYARRWVALDPLNEPALRCLIRLYARSEQRAAAVQQHAECEKGLPKDLRVLPHKATARLGQIIQGGDDLTAGAAPVERIVADGTAQIAARTGKAPTGMLPAQLTPFVGREKEMAAIGERLRDPDCRLLTLVGPGGIGKTWLAVEAVREHEDAFADGVVFCPLAPLQSADGIVPTVAQALGFSFYHTRTMPRQQLLDYLRHKSVLLVMDNFEPLLAGHEGGLQQGGVGLISDILRTASGIKVVVTSRARLNVQEEHLFPVRGMSVPKKLDRLDVTKAPEWYTRHSAMTLFLSRARRVRPEFRPTDEDLVAIARICQQVQGVPLAIALAAAWIEILTPAEIAAEIERGLLETETSLRDLPRRHRSMRAVFDHSWDLLTEPECEVFQALSVFRGGFTRGSAQAVAGATLVDLMSLAHKSLLRCTPLPATGFPSASLGRSKTGGRYEVMHELLRQYAADKLEASTQANAIRLAHGVYYAQFMQQREADLKGRRQLLGLQEIETEFENIRAAWYWATEQQRHSIVSQLLRGLGWFCEFKSRHQEFRDLLKRAREQLAPAFGETPHLVWAQIPVAEFYARFHQADRAQIERSLAIARAHRAGECVISCLGALGDIASSEGAYAESLSFYERSYALSRSLRDPFLVAETLVQMAEAHRLLGQPREAIGFARQSLALSRKIGDRFWAARSLAHTGTLSFCSGNYLEAQGYLQEANAVYREMGYKVGIADTNLSLAKIAFVSACFEDARALAGQALEIASDMGHARRIEAARQVHRLAGKPFEEELGVPVPVPPPDIDMAAANDRYRVTELIGPGGMTCVYIAYDLDSGCKVALKAVKKQSLAERPWIAPYLKREAETLVGLRHPAIVRCYGYGETVDYIYVALEFLEGGTLEEVLEEKDGFLSEGKVIDWAVQICDALAHIHSLEPSPILHRDIKPGNVNIGPDGRARLFDLGLAEPYLPGRDQFGAGTPGYTSPEQCLGYSDARSEVYGMGATLHHLLTRRDPRVERFFSFHDAPPRSLNPAISEALEAVVLKATEHNPLDRYQSMEEMKAALLACLQKDRGGLREPCPTPTPGSPRARSPSRRRRRSARQGTSQA